MASKGIDDNVTITSDTDGFRPLMTYGNVHKWPIAEVEFIRSITHGGSKSHTTVVDSISFRQMYLRSYPFSTKETEEEGGEGGGEAVNRRNNQCCLGGRKKKAAKKATEENQTSSYRVFVFRHFRLVWKCLSCASTTKVTSVDH